MERLIVTRHEGNVEFIHEEIPAWRGVPVLGSVTEADVTGKQIIGNLPIDMASLAASIRPVVFPPRKARGSEMSVEEMRAAGARISGPFVVFTLEDFERHLAAAKRAGYDQGYYRGLHD